MTLEDFSLYKLKSSVFLIGFPLTFTQAILNVWAKSIPVNPGASDEFTREEIEQILATKVAVKEFGTNLITHIQSLHQYLVGIK